MTDHRDTVRAIYEAFGRGDAPAILAKIHPDVEWEYGGREAAVPWLRAGRGPRHVAAFFGAVAENLEFREFRVNAVLGEGDVVVALVDLVARVKSTGKLVTERDEAHVWRFGPDGRIARFRHAADTAQHEEAAR